MNQISINGYTRITKQAARKRHNNGLVTYILACKLSPDNCYIPPVPLSDECIFSEIVNEFEYFNCGPKTGNYAAFYVKEV